MEDAGHPDAGTGRGASAPDDRLDDRALEELRGRVAAAVRRHCPPWLADHADDIVQNAMLKLYRSVKKSDGVQTFSSVYLEKSVCGAVVDEIRRACRRREDPLKDPQDMERFATQKGDPEHGASSRDIASGIRECLERVIRPRRLAVTLYLYGCTVPEAATQLRWSLHKTESLVYRGLADLRRCLERKGLKP